MAFRFKERKGSIYAIVSGLFYSLLGYFGVTIMNDNFSVANMSLWRFLAASLFMAVLVMPSFKTSKIGIKDSLKIITLGGVFYGGCSILYFIAAKYIGTGLAIVIFFTYPAFVLIINKFLYRTRITRNYTLAVTMIMIGLILLIDLKELKVDLLGIVLSIFSGVLYAGYVIFSKQMTTPPLMTSLMACIGCAIISGIYAAFDNSLAFPSDLDVCLNILGVGIISTALPMIFLLEALKYISSEKGAILSVLEPVFMVIVGVVLLNEKIYLLQGVGVIVILTGSLITLINTQAFNRYKSYVKELFFNNRNKDDKC